MEECFRLWGRDIFGRRFVNCNMIPSILFLLDYYYPRKKSNKKQTNNNIQPYGNDENNST